MCTKKNYSKFFISVINVLRKICSYFEFSKMVVKLTEGQRKKLGAKTMAKLNTFINT